MKLILASCSPRRAASTARCWIRVSRCVPADVDETRIPHETAEDYVQRVAQAKAQRRRSKHAPHERTRHRDRRGHDGSGDRPNSREAEDAARRPPHVAPAQRQNSRSSHRLCVILSIPYRRGISSHGKNARGIREALGRGNRKLHQTGEPFDKAGAYGIQGIAGRFAARIDGCYFNVLGLPLSRLWTDAASNRLERTRSRDELSRAAKENGGPPGRRQKLLN